MKILFKILGLPFLFISCDNLSSKSKVIEQKIVYDSLYNKSHKFDIQLYTKIEFDKNELKRKEYNDFSIVINKDTFALVPEINDLKIKTDKERLDINFYSKIDFSSKTYKSDSISNIIKDSYVITSDGKKIEKNGMYKLKSLVSLSYRSEDVKPKPNDINM